MTALDTLAAHLRVPTDALAALSAYDDERIGALDALIQKAFEDEDRSFDSALEEALRFVPRLLRPAAKKLLFGGGQA